MKIPKLTPNLWFDNQAEDAAKFYTSLFPDSKIVSVMRYDEASAKAAGGKVGSALMVEFMLNGQRFTALNGGPVFKLSEAFSIMIDCKDQKEVDFYWEKLTSDGGQESMCGWVKDKYGLSWQVIPRRLMELQMDPDKKKASAVMAAMLKMRKIEIPKLEEAYNSA